MFTFEYMGNLHIHSIHSWGGSDASEIARAASKAGLHFICINGHDHLGDSLHLTEEGFHKGVLVLMGLEIGEHHNHIVAYDLKEMIRSNSKHPNELIDQINKQGGFGFLTYDPEKDMPSGHDSTAHLWKDLSVAGDHGICIWHFTLRWKEHVKTIFHALFLKITKRQSFRSPSRKSLAFWDALCQHRKVSAIGGSDAPGYPFKWGFISIKPISYEYMMSTVNVHILLNKYMPIDFKEAKKEVYGALKEGRLFIANERLCPARGFKYFFIGDDGSDLFMGEESKFHPGKIVIELPAKGEIRLFRDGILEKKWRSSEAIYRVPYKGVYRVEVYRRRLHFRWQPWIFSNPIYLR